MKLVIKNLEVFLLCFRMWLQKYSPSLALGSVFKWKLLWKEVDTQFLTEKSETVHSLYFSNLYILIVKRYKKG